MRRLEFEYRDGTTLRFVLDGIRRVSVVDGGVDQ